MVVAFVWSCGRVVLWSRVRVFVRQWLDWEMGANGTARGAEAEHDFNARGGVWGRSGTTGRGLVWWQRTFNQSTNHRTAGYSESSSTVNSPPIETMH